VTLFYNQLDIKVIWWKQDQYSNCWLGKLLVRTKKWKWKTNINMTHKKNGLQCSGLTMSWLKTCLPFALLKQYILENLPQSVSMNTEKGQVSWSHPG
jgi:hypothetical protein